MITTRSPERLRTDIKTEDIDALFIDYVVRIDDEIEIVHGVTHREGMRQRMDSDHEFPVRLMSTTPSVLARTSTHATMDVDLRFTVACATHHCQVFRWTASVPIYRAPGRAGIEHRHPDVSRTGSSRSII